MSSSKRIVLHHATGLYQILGLETDLKASLQLNDLPLRVEPVDFLDHQGACELVSVTPHYVLYREIVPGSLLLSPSIT